MNPFEAQVRASFFYGLGSAAALFGIGLGGRPNKLALLTAIGSLAYANSISPVVDVAPRPELQQSFQQTQQRFTPSALPLPQQGTFQFSY